MARQRRRKQAGRKAGQAAISFQERQAVLVPVPLRAGAEALAIAKPMIIDCHTHIWEQHHFSDALHAETQAAYPGARLAVRLEDHRAAMDAVDRAIVFGIQARATGFWVPNDYVATYVKAHPQKLIGFASVDPTDAGPSTSSPERCPSWACAV